MNRRGIATRWTLIGTAARFNEQLFSRSETLTALVHDQLHVQTLLKLLVWRWQRLSQDRNSDRQQIMAEVCIRRTTRCIRLKIFHSIKAVFCQTLSRSHEETIRRFMRVSTMPRCAGALISLVTDSVWHLKQNMESAFGIRCCNIYLSPSLCDLGPFVDRWTYTGYIYTATAATKGQQGFCKKNINHKNPNNEKNQSSRGQPPARLLHSRTLTIDRT